MNQLHGSRQAEQQAAVRAQAQQKLQQALPRDSKPMNPKPET